MGKIAFEAAPDEKFAIVMDDLVDLNLGPTDTCAKSAVLFDEGSDAARPPSHYLGHHNVSVSS